MKGNNNKADDAAGADHRAPPAPAVAIAGQTKKQDSPVNSHHSNRRDSGKSTTYQMSGVAVLVNAAESQQVGESSTHLPPTTTTPLRNNKRATVLGRRHTRRVTHFFVSDAELDAILTDHYKGLSVTSKNDNDDGAAMMVDAPQNESRNDQGGH
jgi:hypothetical protein